MKGLFRGFLINFAALFFATELLPGLRYDGGFKTLAVGAVMFMVINFAVVPLLKVLLLPLNLLTFGFFTWATHVIALFFLTILVPQFRIVPFVFTGLGIAGFVIPQIELNVLQVAIIASFLIGLTSNFLQWLSK